MPDSDLNQMDETGERILMLVAMLKHELHLVPSADAPDLADGDIVRIFGKCMSTVGVRFLRYFSNKDQSDG